MADEERVFTHRMDAQGNEFTGITKVDVVDFITGYRRDFGVGFGARLQPSFQALHDLFRVEPFGDRPTFPLVDAEQEQSTVSVREGGDGFPDGAVDFLADALGLESSAFAASREECLMRGFSGNRQ